MSAEVDQILSDVSHFLGRSKKDLVDAAVRDYVEAHRDEINAGISDSISRLDGSAASVVALVGDLSTERLDELGGLPER
ncbi:hypothetical protein [Isoptericola sp. BMS4]|uniref:hypothetical protein n=1 Tax=Isoptericola sp. BMS4 TaxID=2527875 RepID=UPI001F110148|nr:hypothetical protein [Isoptericola sp. BMS4]